MNSKYLIKQLIGSLIFFSIIFISAGTLFYIPGLVYASVGLIMLVLNYTLLKPDKELFEERSKPGAGTKKWDKVLLGLMFLSTISVYVVAGLDSGRFHWSPEFPEGLFYTGIILTAAGQLIFLIAQKQNSFFSSTVRIQTEREHRVCDSGLYGYVRHPGYLGSIFQAAGFPLLFRSYWSIIPASLLLVLHLIRTQLEDATLREHLDGYSQYTERTKYRIIPYIW